MPTRLPIRRLPFLLAAFSLALAAAAGAQPMPPSSPQAGGAAGFAAKRAMPDPMIADTNKDGYIDRNEAAQRPRLARHFDAIDTNKDGLLTKAEIDAYIAKRRAEHAAKPPGAGGVGAHGAAGGHGAGMFARLDTNGDGFIDRNEAASRPRLAPQFDAIDANRDGRLSKDELRAWRQQHHPRAAGGGARPQ